MPLLLSGLFIYSVLLVITRQPNPHSYISHSRGAIYHHAATAEKRLAFLSESQDEYPKSDVPETPSLPAMQTFALKTLGMLVDS